MMRPVRLEPLDMPMAFAYLERRIDDTQRLADERWRHQETITRTLQGFNDERRVVMEARLAGMNEIRQQLNTQASTFCTVATFEAERLHQLQTFEVYKQSRIDYGNTLEERIRKIEQFQANINGRIIGFTAAGAALATLLGVIVNFLHP